MGAPNTDFFRGNYLEPHFLGGDLVLRQEVKQGFLRLPKKDSRLVERVIALHPQLLVTSFFIADKHLQGTTLLAIGDG